MELLTMVNFMAMDMAIIRQVTGIVMVMVH